MAAKITRYSEYLISDVGIANGIALQILSTLIESARENLSNSCKALYHTEDTQSVDGLLDVINMSKILYGVARELRTELELNEHRKDLGNNLQVNIYASLELAILEMDYNLNDKINTINSIGWIRMAASNEVKCMYRKKVSRIEGVLHD